MTPVHLIATAPMVNTITSTKKGLASIFGATTTPVRRHSVNQVSSRSPENRSASVSKQVVLVVPYSSIQTLSSSTGISALFPGNSTKRSSMDRAAERDWNEQAKQVFQLSTVNDRGHFLPPTPTEKGYKENVKENEKDYFATIVSTPPERVRTFLSTESTISPGMFSLPSSKIKRHTIPSYSPPVDSSTAFNQRRNVSDGDSCNKSDSVSSNAKNLSKSSAHSADSVIIHHPPKVSAQALSESVSTPSSSPSSVSSKDAFSLPSPPTTPQPQQRQQQQPSPVLRHADVRRKSRAQISFLTGSTMEEEDLTDVLSDTLSSLLLSSSPPELVMDEGDHSSSSSGSNNSSTLASPNTSPRHSLTLPKEQIQKMNTQKLRSQYNFGSDQQIGHL